MRHRNRTLSLLLTLVPALGCDTPAPDRQAVDPAAQRDAAEEAVTTFFDAIEATDFTALESTVTSDFELVEDTLILDTSGFIELLRPFAEAGASLTYELSDFNTELRGPVAWTRYWNRAVLVRGGDTTNLEWLESAVLLRGEEGWKIDRLQSTPVVEPPGER